MRSSERYVGVQFYPWFEFYIPLFQFHDHTLPCSKAKENDILTKDKVEPQHCSTCIYVTEILPGERITPNLY